LSVEYRRDINGLRAIAVVPVLLFHAGIKLFSGGYVGVDVFFVISGFLITKILFHELQQGKFSLVAFYERRVRRLLPSLLAMLVLTTWASLFYLTPSELADYGKMLLASMFFMANILLYFRSDYFNDASDVNPLLHMWSLAVEEQFYIFFPLILFVSYKLLKHRTYAVVLCLGILSFYIGYILLDYNASLTFYAFPTRAWELLIGSLLALEWIPRLKHRVLKQLLSLVGLVMLSTSITLFSEETRFPGFNAVLPTFGAALLIYTGGGAQPTVVERLLSLRALVFIGLISYPLYLFHWPALLFGNQALQDLARPLQLTVIFTVTFLLAYFSYHYIEQFIRHREFFRSQKQIMGWGAISTASVAAMAVIFVLAKGFPERYGIDKGFYARVELMKQHSQIRSRVGKCYFGSKYSIKSFNKDSCLLNTSPSTSDVLLIGDSHAAQLYPALANKLENIRLSQLNSGGCRALLDIVTRDDANCRAARDYWFKVIIPNNDWDTIIVASQWQSSDLPNLNRTLRFLQPHARKIILIGPGVEYYGHLPELYKVSQYLKAESIYVNKLKHERFELDREMEKMSLQLGVNYISITKTICQAEKCLASTPNGNVMQLDASHLSEAGVDWLVTQWIEDKTVALRDLVAADAKTQSPANDIAAVLASNFSDDNCHC
jgi:peptidoglycan/LPS O-acetylase OafA/YrhL